MREKPSLAAALLLMSGLMFFAALEIAPCSAQPGTSLKPDLANGKLIFAQKCEACHFDLSSERKIGPGLAELMRRARFKNGMPADEYHLRRVIERGGKNMPPFREALNEKQTRDLIAYLKTL